MERRKKDLELDLFFSASQKRIHNQEAPAAKLPTPLPTKRVNAVPPGRARLARYNHLISCTLIGTAKSASYVATVAAGSISDYILHPCAFAL